MKTMKRTNAVAVLLCVAVALSAVSPDWELYYEVENLYLDAEYEEALVAGRQFLRDFPFSDFLPQIEYRQALSMFRLGRHEEALELLGRIAKRHRNASFVNYLPFWSGMCYYELGDHEPAVESFDTFLAAVTDETVNPQALLYKTLSLLSLAKITDAIQTVAELNAAYPESELRPYGIVLLMSLLFNRELHDDIVGLSETLDAATFPPEWRDIFRLYTAEAYRQKGDLDVAEQMYRSLVDANPPVASVAYQRLYFSAQQRGDFSEMNTILQAAEGKFADKPDIMRSFWLRAGIESFERSILDLAELFFTRVWSLRRQVELETEAPLYFAETLVLKGDLERAIAILEEYLGFTNLDAATIVMKLGNLYFSEPDYAQAAEYYARLLEQKPDSSLIEKAGYHLAYCYHKIGRLDEARALIVQLQGQFPDGEYDQAILRLKVNVLAESIRVAEARASMRQYVGLYSDDVQARADLVKLLFAESNFLSIFQEGPSLFTAFSEYQADKPASFLNNQFLIGVSSVLEGAYGQGLAALEFLTPEQVEAHGLQVIYPHRLYYAGWGLYKSEQYAQAAAVLGDLIESYPEHELRNNALYLAGWAHYNIEEYMDASAYFAQLPEGNQELSLRGRFQNGKSLRAAGEFGQAAGLFKGLYEENLDSHLADFAMLEYAEVLAQMGQVDDSDRVFRELPIRFPTSRLRQEAMYKLGQLNFGAERFAEAKAVFEDLRRRFPRGAYLDAALYFGGQAAYELGETTGAQLLWEKLIEEHRESGYRAEAMIKTAEVYADKKEYAEAVRLYANYIALYPDEAKQNPDVGKRASQLRLLLLGSSPKEAELESIIALEGRDSTKGRKAMTELAELYILEDEGDPELARNMLLQVIEQKEPETASVAQMLLGAYYYKKGDPQQAAEHFLKTLDENPPDADLAAQALYRAAEMMKLQGQADQVKELVKRIEDEYPDSQWLNEGKKLLEGLQ